MSQVERGKVTPSWDLVNTYGEAFGGDPVQLRQLYLRMQDESAAHRTELRRAMHPASKPPETAPQRIDELTDHQQIRRHYTVEHRAEHYTFDANGVTTGLHCRNHIRATSADVVLFVARHTYDSDRRPQVLEVTGDHGCRVDTVRTYRTGGVEAYLRMDRSLQAGDGPHELAHRVTVASAERAYPRLIFQAPAGLRQFDISATFAAPSLPRELWWFEAFGTIDAEQPRHRLRLNTEGYCCKSFRSPAAGWYYGIAWTW